MKSKPTPRRQSAFHTALLLLAGIIAWAPLPATAGTDLSLGTEHTRGNYGSMEATDCWYYPLTLRHWHERWTISLTVPYLRISGPAAVVGSLGNRVVFDTTTGMAKRTTVGLGDVEAGASYQILAEPDDSWRGDLGVKWKFPTGDAAKGLGTGSADHALEGALQRRIGAMTAFANLGWRHMGNAGSTLLENVWYGTAGASYQFSPSVQAGAAWSYRETVVEGGAPLRLATAYLNLAMAHGLTLQTYLLQGHSDASPDNGAGINLTWAY